MNPLRTCLRLWVVLLATHVLFRHPADASTNTPTRLVKDLQLQTTAAGIISGGNLTLPTTEGPHPAVILLGGGFQPLTDELTRRGIAVLNFDLRGSGKSEGTHSFWNPEAIAEDTALWLQWLKQRPEIDRKLIGLIGHSQRGVAATLVAAKATNDVGFVVLLASIGVPVLEWQAQRAADLVLSMGADQAVAAKFATFQRELLQNIVAANDTAEATQRARSIATNHLARFTAEERSQVGLSDEVAEQFSKQAGEAHFRHYLAYDPRPALRQIRCPVFALHGLADLQVSAKENLASIAAELKAGGNARVKLLELPGLDHEFQAASINSTSANSGGQRPVSQEVVEAVSTWVADQTKR